MNYEKLDKTQRLNMMDARLTQYEQEHFNHAVNVKLLEASGLTDAATMEAIADGKAAMATLDKAHANTKTEKSKIV